MVFLRFEPFSVRNYWRDLVQRSLDQDTDKGLLRLQVLMGAIALRTKDATLVGLPPKTTEVCYAELSLEERELYDQMKEQTKTLLSSFGHEDSLVPHYSAVLSRILKASPNLFIYTPPRETRSSHEFTGANLMDRHQSNSENTKFLDKKIYNDNEQMTSLNQDSSSCFNKHVEECNPPIITFEQTSNYTIEEIEEVYGKIEEERHNIHHILEIKEVLVNSENKTETEMTVSLQKLALIIVSLEDLMVTGIGTVVSSLQLHWSKKVIREAKMVAE
ncbi:hypothetical protein Fmac_029598 [Flemingia macrophylla]|uniref:SNF2 N-terminal domain-containing protein n=1 Tax=Flemingia macrophylla TaxID=520843 RepID=A0ABD1LAU1_9FABA